MPIHTTTADGIARIVLDAPPVNALTDALVFDKDYHQEAAIPMPAGGETHGGGDVFLGAAGVGAEDFHGVIDNTAVFSDFVNAAIKEAGAGAAVYFNYKGDAYVVIDSHTNSAGDTFINGEDLVVKLTGINGDNLSWNSEFATVALV